MLKSLLFKSKSQKTIVFLLSIFFAASCVKKKEIVEHQLVVTKQDLSIQTNYDIVCFDNYTATHILAIGHYQGDFKLFLTSNGGQSWNEINKPYLLYAVEQDDIQSAVYMGLGNLAVVIDNVLYRSFNEGQTWESVNEFTHPLSVFFAGKTNEDKLVFVENNNSYPNRVLISNFDELTYTQIGTTPTVNMYYNSGHLNDNYITFLSFDNDFYNDKFHCFNLTNNTHSLINFNSNAYQYPRDALVQNGTVYLFRKNGIIEFLNNYFTSGSTHSFYQYHDQNYYSGDVVGDFVVAVGVNTISSNYSGIWEEAINTDGTGHNEVFRKVKNIDDESFYISGDNGLFLKSTFK